MLADFGGSMLLLIDVVSKYVRRQRLSGPEIPLYYGLNTSFTLGSVVFGRLCLWLAW